MAVLLVVLSLLLINTSFAYEAAITERVAGKEELNAKEVVFLSGEPIVFEGTLEYEESIKGEEETREYTYNLESLLVITFKL